MKKLILLLALLASSATFAQDYYMAKYSEKWEYNYRLGKYTEVDATKEYTRIILHREWFALEKTEENFLRWEWVYFQDLENLGECYIVEGDNAMGCINYNSDKFFLFVNFNKQTENWDDTLILSDIHKIPSFQVNWKLNK
jgi:hypothetical protein